MRQVCGLITLIGLLVGCGDSAPPPREPDALVEVSGKVTLNGEPLEGAMVIFNPNADGGFNAFGYTDSSGKYVAETRVGMQPRPGISPGSYQVMVSRFLKPDGTLPLDPTEPPANTGAMESLPPEYSSPTNSRLRAVVGSSGGEFNYDIKMAKK